MYGRQFMCLTRGRPVRKYSSLQYRKCRRMNICFEAGMFMRFFDLIWR